jgi:predicted aminopeptidase
MKKIIICLLILGLSKTNYAQTENKTAGLHCASASVGGCWSVGILSGCTSHTYHVQVCCGHVHAHVGCTTTTWSTANRSAKNGEEVVFEKSTVEAEVTKFALENNVNLGDVKYFNVLSSDPFEDNGELYVIKNGSYLLDKSVSGWAIMDLEKIKFVK